MLNTNQESKSINLSLCDGICKPIVKPSKSNNNWWIISKFSYFKIKIIF